MTKAAPKWASRGAMAATALALVLLVGSLLPYLRSSSEAVRLRNALLFDRATEADFNWTPEQVPASFAVDTQVPAGPLGNATRALMLPADASDWDKSLRIATHLVKHAGEGGAARADLVGTYNTILGGGGYCADFTSTFVAMAATAGIFAREWAFSFDGYGGHGHVLIEIWDRTSRQWRMLDVFNNFFATDAQGRPLTALEFRAAIAAGRRDVPIHRIGPARDGFRYQNALFDYYRKGADQWYLWWGNAVYRYDDSTASRWLSPVSRSAEQLAAIAEGVHPRIRAFPTPSNAGLRDEAVHLKWRLLGTAVAGTLLLLLLLIQAIAHRRAKRRSGRTVTASGS